MQIEDGFWRHLASYGIDGFPFYDIHHLARARSTPRITVPNAAYDFGVRSSAIAVEWPLLLALASSSGRVHLLVGLSRKSIPSGRSGPTGMNCSSTRFSLERG